MSVEKSVKKRRSAIKIMGQLIGLVAPLLHIMLLAILLGPLYVKSSTYTSASMVI